MTAADEIIDAIFTSAKNGEGYKLTLRFAGPIQFHASFTRYFFRRRGCYSAVGNGPVQKYFLLYVLQGRGARTLQPLTCAHVKLRAFMKRF